MWNMNNNKKITYYIAVNIMKFKEELERRYMNNLLIFFALPVATILLSITAQKILKCPILVAITTFAIYLIITFARFDSFFLVFTIVYTIPSFITAYITQIFIRRIEVNERTRNITNNNCSNCCRRY